MFSCLSGSIEGQCRVVVKIAALLAKETRSVDLVQDYMTWTHVFLVIVWYHPSHPDSLKAHAAGHIVIGSIAQCRVMSSFDGPHCLRLSLFVKGGCMSAVCEGSKSKCSIGNMAWAMRW